MRIGHPYRSSERSKNLREPGNAAAWAQRSGTIHENNRLAHGFTVYPRLGFTALWGENGIGGCKLAADGDVYQIDGSRDSR